MDPDCWRIGETAFLHMSDFVDDVEENQNVMADRSESFYNEVDRLTKVVCSTLKSETSRVLVIPRQTGPLFGNVHYVEGPTSGVTGGNFDMNVILEASKSLFPNIFNVIRGILVKNSEQLGLDPLSLETNATNTISFRFISNGSTVELRVVPTEISTAPC